MNFKTLDKYIIKILDFLVPYGEVSTANGDSAIMEKSGTQGTILSKSTKK